MDETLEFAAGAQAFGDGNHPTTMGVLAALEAIDAEQFSPHIACDMGCGSGILAMAIARRFGCPVIAADLERQAIETVLENSARNGLADRIQAVHSDGFNHPDLQGPFELITMNILAEPLLRLAADAAARLAPGGVLILSGILKWQEEQVRAAYGGLGLELATRLVVGDWVSLCFQKPE